MESIRIQKKQGSIVEVLRNEILSGRIPSGTEMTQNDLAQSLGVSRMPVREALILLEYQGLLVRLPNNHVRVAELTEQYLHSLFELSEELEREALNRLEDIGVLPDEVMPFHRILYENYPYSFQKKILESLVEIYVYYGTHCENYQKLNGERKISEIKAALQSQQKTAADILLHHHLMEIKEAILVEREKIRC